MKLWQDITAVSKVASRTVETLGWLFGELFHCYHTVRTDLLIAPWHRSFVLSLHIFSVLFLRLKPSSAGRYIVVIVGWLAIATVVAVGPLAIQDKSRGDYFGPSGFWSVHEYSTWTSLTFSTGAG